MRINNIIEKLSLDELYMIIAISEIDNIKELKKQNPVKRLEYLRDRENQIYEMQDELRDTNYQFVRRNIK